MRQPGSVAHGEDDPAARRSVVPDAAGRSPWLAAVWTGLGAAIVCATLAIVVVALCWLPVSQSSGRTTSAIRAGLLSFLASVHGGITVDGVATTWLPLGMLAIVGLTAWRAGSGLGDAAAALGEQDPARLALAGGLQVLSFTAGCLTAVPFATLGTSRVPFVGVALGATLLFALTGGAAYVRACPLRSWVAERVPSWFGVMVRAGGGAVLVYLAAGALLVAAALVVHHDRVEQLSAAVGGGAGGIPILLLGVLAAPNAAVAASSYLAGPGFAVGTGTTVGLTAATHGTLPAFPVLAAVPSGSPNPAVWTLVALTPLFAGVGVARSAWRADRWAQRFGIAVGAASTAGLLALLLAWLAGGAVGDGALHTVGAPPVLLGGAVAAAVAAVSLVLVAVAAGWHAIARRYDEDTDEDLSILAALRSPRLRLVSSSAPTDDAEERDDLAG